VQEVGATEVLIFGNPSTSLSSLTYAEQEAVTIGSLLDTAVYTGTRATEARLWDEAADKNIIHLATHGEYNAANSLYSTIFLAPDGEYDGRLETWEIFALPLVGTDLVTLSACETNLNDVTPGDELIGLTRAFFFAGAPTVLSSLWQVNDAATEALMTEFYRTWKEKGLSKAEALQAAQAKVAADPRWHSPFYWSGFVLNGHPGEHIGPLAVDE
jgi:CHAT domain-containing protein